MTTALQVALFLIAPAAAIWACRRWRSLELLSPVVLCYLFGIAVGNQRLIGIVEEVSDGVAAGSVLLAIALLLVASDLSAWLRLARVTMRSVALALVSVVVVSAATAVGFSKWLGDSWKIAGMLVGVYTGGTANMAAIANALQVDASTFVMVHTSDVLVCALYLVFLLLLAGRVFGLFLKPFARQQGEEISDPSPNSSGSSFGLRDVGLALGLGSVVIALAGVVGLLFPAGARDSVVILVATSVALTLSFSSRVRSLRATFETGDYMLLIFCVAVGSMARIDKLASIPPEIFAYTATVVFCSISFHLMLCKLFGVDRDTCIITSTAAIFGPAFIGPVAAKLRNKEIIVSGVTAGLIGLAAGNYLGLMVAYATRFALG